MSFSVYNFQNNTLHMIIRIEWVEQLYSKKSLSFTETSEKTMRRRRYTKNQTISITTMLCDGSVFCAHRLLLFRLPFHILFRMDMQHQFVLHIKIKKKKQQQEKRRWWRNEMKWNESGTKCTRDENVCWYIIDDVPHGCCSCCCFFSRSIRKMKGRFSFFNLFKLWYCAGLSCY